MLEKIAIEQSNGWHYLRQLLEKWDEIFGPYQERIYRVNSKMKKHEVYLSAVYDKILPEIKLALAKGVSFVKCRICKMKSSEVTKLSDYLFKYQCRVCHYSEEYLDVPCDKDDCVGFININGYCSGQTHYNCPDCHSELSHEELSNLLDAELHSPDEISDYRYMNCAECDVPEK